TIECKVGALRRHLHERFPDVRGFALVALFNPHVAEIQVRRHGAGIEIDRRLETADRFRKVLPPHGLEPDFVFQERENRLALRPRFNGGEFVETLPRGVGLQPLMLFLVELLQVDQGVLVGGVEAKHLVERFERPIDEAATLVVEPQAEEDVGMLDLAETCALQQRLMGGDGFSDLALFPVQIAENHVDFERVRIAAGRPRPGIAGQIDLVGDQKVEPEDVVRRLPGAPAIDPGAAAEFVALPRLADRQSDEQRHECGEERSIRAHDGVVRATLGSFKYAVTTPSQRFCAFSTSSINSRAAPLPAFAVLTQCTRDRTSSTASAGAAASPARASTAKSTTSSPMYATSRS